MLRPLFLLLLLLAAAGRAVRDADDARREELLYHADTDPMGEADHWASLSSITLRSLFRPVGTIQQRVAALRDLDVVAHVTLHLVGFGRLDTISELLESVAASRPLGDTVPARSRCVFAVKHARRGLALELERAVAAYVAANGTGVPFYVVDRAVAREARADSGYSVFVMNLRVAQPYTYGNAECGQRVWASGRHVWVDLGAVQAVFGPRSAGSGLQGVAPVTAEPHDVVVWVQRVCEHLITPPLDHLPIPLAPPAATLRVELVVVHDGTPESEDPPWDAITRMLAGLDVPTGPSVVFGRQRLSLAECRGCARALAMATRAHAGAVGRRALRVSVQAHLDSVELRRGVMQMMPAHAGVPVVVFSLSTHDVVLLDRTHQAVAFSDVVIAVQTRAGRVFIDQQCNGKRVAVSSLDVARPIAAAVLQCVWGVAPTHASMAQTTTPFGPFSAGLGLAFGQLDAARRNVVLSAMAGVTGGLDARLRHGHGGGGDATRWGVMAYMMRRASETLAVWDYETALWWVRVAGVAAREIHWEAHDTWRYGGPMISAVDVLCLVAGAMLVWQVGVKVARRWRNAARKKQQ